jgi:NADH dehydrogenase (ubiquinone) Fe-S protein 6
MLTSSRLRIPALAAQLTRIARRPATTASPGTGENREQANDPTPTKEPPNISKTNEVGVTTFGAHDGVLQESAQEGERQRQLQAPNRSTIWSRSQQPRDKAMTGPRFEQTIMEHQVSQHCLRLDAYNWEYESLIDDLAATTLRCNRVDTQAACTVDTQQSSRL